MDEEKKIPDDLAENEENEVQKRSKVGPFFVTLIILAIVGALAYMPTYFDQVYAEDPENAANNGWMAKMVETSEGWWIDNAGEYHPLFLHVPIGIIFLAVAMEVLGWLSFGKYKPRTTLALFLAFVGGTLACVSGMFMLKTGGGYSVDTSVAFDTDQWKEGWANDMFKHMWMGIAFVAVVGLAFLAKVWSRPGAGRGPIYAILLFGTAGIMGYGSHYGGLQTHGSDPVATTMVNLGILPEKKKDGDVKTKTKTVQSLPKDRLAFAEVVMPIFDNRCLACHSEAAGKKKGKLYMDSYANLIAGGRSKKDDFPTLVPGHADESYMIEVITLPLDDDMRMPPEDEVQIEEHEVRILTWWVNNIPKRDSLDDATYEDKTLEEMGAPQEILDAVANLASPEERAAIEAAEKAAVAKAEQERAAKREALQNSLDALKQQDAFKTSLKYVSRDSSDLDFTSVSLRSNLNDETFAKLAPVAGALVSVDVSASSVSEGALAEMLPKMTSLRRLNLSQTEVGDGLLEVIANLKDLEYLNVYGTKVTDTGILKLKSLAGLKQLFGWQSQVTEEGAKALKKELPGLYVNLGSVELK